MEPEDGAMSRFERTFWTFWNYITDTVNRILRPEPPVNDTNAANTSQDTSECLDTNDGTNREVEDENHCAPIASATSVQPFVPWDIEPELESATRLHSVEGELDETVVDVANLPTIRAYRENQEESRENMNADRRISISLKNHSDETANKIKESEQKSCTLEEAISEHLKENDREEFIEKVHREEHVSKTQNDYLDLEKDETTVVKETKTKSSEMEDFTVVQRESNPFNSGQSVTPDKHDECMTMNVTAQEIEAEDQGAKQLLDVSKFDMCLVETAERVEESNEDMNKKDQDDYQKQHTSWIMEIEDVNNTPDATLLQPKGNSECYEEEKSNDEAERMEENQSWKLYDAPPHANLSMSENIYVTVQESERVEQCVMNEANISAQQNENMTSETRNDFFEHENQEGAKDIAVNDEKCMTNQNNYSCNKRDEEMEDVVRGDLKKPSVLFVMEPEILSQRDNKLVKNVPQVIDDSSIMQQLNEVISEENITVKKSIAANVLNDGAIFSLEMPMPGLFTETICNKAENNDTEVSSEADNHMGKPCITEEHEGGSTREEGTAIKNIPPDECEGQDSKQLYSYKESRREVPGHNNESSIESTAQRFLEVGNGKENHTILLQEEVESGATKGLQNKGCNEGVDSLGDPMETEAGKENYRVWPEQDSQADMKTAGAYKVFEMDLPDEKEEEEIDLAVIDFEMGEALCEVENAGPVSYNFQDCIFSIQPDIECGSESLRALKEEDTTNAQITESYFEKVHLEGVVEDSTKELIDFSNSDISSSAFSDKNASQSYPEQQICNDVIEEELLDLWIKQTSIGEDQGQLGSLEKPGLNTVNVLLTTTESGFFDQSSIMEDSHDCKDKELPKTGQLVSTIEEFHESENDQCAFSTADSLLETLCTEDLLRKKSSSTPDSIEDDTDSPNIFISCSEIKGSSNFPTAMDAEPVKRMRTLLEQDILENIQPDSPNIIENTLFMPDTPIECHFQQNSQVVACPESKQVEETHKVCVSELDFTSQKSRIAVKNPRARPPKDPRSLLQKPSLEPSLNHLPSQSPLGTRVKLPGLGGGFPIVKKTKETAEDETEKSAEGAAQEENCPLKPENSPQKPKWMPTNSPSFGNPLMSELKRKLKKTAKE